MELFHFLRPLWLLALIPLAVLVWLMIRKKLGSRSWEAICDENLLPHILIGRPDRTRRLAAGLTAAGGLLFILALAGPTWEKLPQPVFSDRSALVIALDLSRSMDANDIKPSRLARARFKVADILNLRREGQTALLVYAGDSYTVTPLTDDTATIASQLNALTTGIMPVPGNRPDLALQLAMELLRQAGASYGDILFITDEISPDLIREPLAEAGEAGYRISVLGIGTRRGVPVPLADGSFLKDRDGRIVIPVLKEQPMQEAAREGGGRYVRMQQDDGDVVRLQEFFAAFRFDGELESTELQTDVWREQGPWLLLLLLPLIALMFRRGYLLLLILCVLPMPDTAQALEWEELWQRPDQRARDLYRQDAYEKAADLFENPAWKGAAQYRTGDYEAALESLRQDETLTGQYNAGNALARMGRYEEAIAMYEKVLQQDPEHEDARFNKELLEQELQSGQKQQQQQSGNDQSQQDREQNNQQEQQQADKPGQGDSGEKQDTGPDQQPQEAGNSEPQDEEQQSAEQSLPQGGEQKDDGDESTQRQTARSGDLTPDEQQQAIEQWLRRIPDDPGGLLRRKFRYQYQQRAREPDPDSKTW